MDINDSSLVECFEKLVYDNPDYWDFREAKKEHIHGIFTYPATMVPMMQSEILSSILRLNPNIENLLDPFMGSGTVLVEGMINGLNVYGIDINPLSYLLCNFKINPSIVEALDKYKEDIYKYLDAKQKKIEIKKFKNRDKWYRQDIAKYLSEISAGIKVIDDREVRCFFWICLAEISRICNNSKNSTFKLHMKSKEEIDNFQFDVIKNYKKIVDENIDRLRKYVSINKNLKYSNTNLYEYDKKRKVFLGDSIEVIQNKFRDNSIDLIITSPPYGDNQTTVTYGQFSVLPLRWIDKEDISDEVDNFMIDIDSRIDSSSLGGKRYSENIIVDSNILKHSETLNYIYITLIESGEKEKARKVASFIMDFNKIIEQMARVLNINGYMVLTVGNRRVYNNEIRFNQIIKELANLYNLELIYEFSRKILGKRIPNKVSKLKDNKSVKSISKEYILILKKK
ncbi:DNA adenine methylase [Clostridium sp. DSM 100503]|uniref:DNA adenine methylase n=1 Tax=Clostridium sp. DSM 100503 TaxID=2963282 RepID=UPI00214A3686|nr:DNA adenine methylase [Clostridium sp. DSM 100503]MCR1950443.1 DNA adenine methylase [Clostridium sp. DSM 100503]